MKHDSLDIAGFCGPFIRLYLRMSFACAQFPNDSGAIK